MMRRPCRDDVAFIQNLASNATHPLFVDCLIWLYTYGDIQNQASFNDHMFHVLINHSDHPKAYKVAEYLLNFSTSYKQKEHAIAFLRDALKQNLDIPRMCEISKILYERGTAEDKVNTRAVHIHIAHNTDLIYIHYATKCAEFLYSDIDKNYQSIGRAVLRQISERRGGLNTHNNTYNALFHLYTFPVIYANHAVDDTNFKEDTDFAKAKFYAIAENPHHLFSNLAISALAEQCEDSEKPYLQSLLRMVVENPNKIGSELYEVNTLSNLLEIGDEPSKELCRDGKSAHMF